MGTKESSNSKQPFTGMAKMADASDKIKAMPYNLAEQLRTPEEIAAYLDAWLVESPDDAAGIVRALGEIVRAKGVSKVAHDAELSPESIHEELSENSDPSLTTVLKVARALGLRLHAEAAS